MSGLEQLAELVAARLKPEPLRYLTMEEFAERLNIHPRTALYVRAQYPSYFTKVGRVWAISSAAFERFVTDFEGHSIDVAPPIQARSGKCR